MIGDHKIELTMFDLGASINVMPWFVYEQLGIGPLKTTGVVIQLADRSHSYPSGVVDKDVLVWVNHLIFPVDFYVLNMEDNFWKFHTYFVGEVIFENFICVV